MNIGVDEVSWRKHHRYLTLVTDHTGKKIVWGAEGKDTATLDAFFDELGEDRSAALQAVSMDMGAAFNKSVRAQGHAPQAVIFIDSMTVSCRAVTLIEASQVTYQSSDEASTYFRTDDRTSSRFRAYSCPDT